MIGTPAADTCVAGRHVAVVLPTLHSGGAERQGILLGRLLAADAGARTSIWGLGAPGEVPELCRAADLPCHVVPHPPGHRRIRQVIGLERFTRRLRRAGAEILLSFGDTPNVLCGLARRRAGASAFIWNQLNDGRYLVGHLGQRLAARRASWFTANSAAGRAAIVRTLGVPPERVTLVRNGVDLGPPARSREAARAALGLDGAAFLACMAGNINRVKDHETLVRAWPRVLERLGPRSPRPVLLLAGRADDGAGELEALVSQLGLGDAVSFLGHVDDVASLLHAVDLGVFSSRSEGCPNGVLECMAAGLAVVATDIEGVREAVGDGALEWLAAPGDAAGFADRVVRLVEDPARRRALGESGRRRIAEAFAPRRMLDATLGVLDRVLAAPA